MKKYKIFVSGVQKELKEERFAVKELVTENYLLNEYFEVFLFEKLAAKSKSPEKVFLEEVKDSDIYVGIFGNKYGWIGKDGLSATEKEYIEAVNTNKERLAFFKNGDSKREDKLKALLSRIKDNTKGHCYKRFNEIDELKNELFRSLVDFLKDEGRLSNNAFDETVCEKATFNDIDEKKVGWFLQTAKAQRKYPLPIDTPVRNVFIHLNLLNNEKPTNAAILLFGKNPTRFLLQAEVKCIQFHGTQVEKPFSSYQIYNGNIFEQIDKAVSFVLDAISFPVIQQEHTAQVKREHEIPVFAIQEAIVNAVAHRDYNNTAAVQVMVFVDRVEIWNPGKLTDNLTIEKLRKTHSSYPTNPLIAQPLYLADYIQKAGSGTTEMIKQCREKGLPEPVFVSDRYEFKTILARDIYTEETLNKLGLNERQMKAIKYVKQNGKITNKEYQKINNISKATATRDLAKLVEMKILLQHGTVGKGTVYEFNTIGS
jgi:predicted HTH transcriptional regulator